MYNYWWISKNLLTIEWARACTYQLYPTSPTRTMPHIVLLFIFSPFPFPCMRQCGDVVGVRVGGSRRLCSHLRPFTGDWAGGPIKSLTPGRDTLHKALHRWWRYWAAHTIADRLDDWVHQLFSSQRLNWNRGRQFGWWVDVDNRMGPSDNLL